MNGDETMPDADLPYPVCVVCRDPHNVIVADCDSYRLSRSGMTIRTKLEEWRVTRKGVQLTIDLPPLGDPNNAPLCNTCLDAIDDVEEREAGLEESIASLFGAEKSQEAAKDVVAEALEDVKDEGPENPVPVEEAVQSVRQSARASVKAKSADIKAKLKQRAQKRPPIDQPEEIKVRRVTDGKIFTVVVEQENESRGDSGCENDSEAITLEIEAEDSEEETRPKYKPKSTRIARAQAAAESPYVAYSLGNLGLEYVERRYGIRGCDTWFDIRECRLCQETFDGRVTELLRHLEDEHGVVEGATLAPQKHPFVCHFCLAGFDALWEYVAHVMFEELWMGEHGWFKCRFCDTDCLNPRRLEAHFEEAHSSDSVTGGPFVCEECVDDGGEMTSFVSLAEFIKHRQSPDNGRHVICIGAGSRVELECPNPVCEFRAECSKDLFKHGKAAEKGSICSRPFHCPAKGTCDTKFDSLVGLERHLAMVEFCPNRHCDTCGVRFPTPMDGEQHRNRVHLKQRPFICDVCGKSYESRNRLNQHKAVHTKQENEEAAKEKMCYLCGKLLTGGKRAVENHVDRFHKRKEIHCKFCGLTFYYRNLLNKHMAKEHDYKRYRIQFPCPICNKVFTSSDSVVVHRFLVHKIRDPRLNIMTCPECGKEFVKRTAFNNHLVGHTGVKPHPCPFCDHRSITFSNLADHCKKIHKKRIRRLYDKRPGADRVVDDLVTVVPEVGEIDIKPEASLVDVSPPPTGAVGRGPGYVIVLVKDESGSVPKGRNRTGANGKPKKMIQVGVPRGKSRRGGSVSDSVLKIKDAVAS